jgi:uncharacterized BrkB/YihY/UPF0761 family membrane protein
MNAQWTTLALVVGWILTIMLGLLGLIIVWLIVSGRINLSNLISEPNGQASLSRFQFLVFTFVIAMSLFLIIMSTSPPSFPPIPGGILALLGISGGSYVVSKGIQTTKEVGIAEATTTREVGIAEATFGKGGAGAAAPVAGVAAVVIPPIPQEPV